MPLTGCKRCAYALLITVLVVFGVCAVIAWGLGACTPRYTFDSDVLQDTSTSSSIECQEIDTSGTPGGAYTLALDVPEVCDDAATLLSYGEGSLGVCASWSVEAGLADVAASILSEYDQRGDLSLYFDGYLDLFSSVWACIVACDYWVDVVVIQESETEYVGTHASQGPCTLTLMRLGAAEMQMAAHPDEQGVE